MAYEEPKYEVLQSAADYEVRRYAPYLVAETDVSGDFGDAGNAAFRILAGYIFGNNQSSQKMNMTAPVESRPAAENVKMEMTVPVTSARAESAPGLYTYAFVMERKYTRETLPVPNDPRVRIRALEPRVLAVRRYSGTWSESRYRKNERKLLDALAADGVAPLGEPVLARYNGPLTPWFLRRNEVMVEVQWPLSDAGP